MSSRYSTIHLTWAYAPTGKLHFSIPRRSLVRSGKIPTLHFSCEFLLYRVSMQRRWVRGVPESGIYRSLQEQKPIRFLLRKASHRVSILPIPFIRLFLLRRSISYLFQWLHRWYPQG